MQRALPPGPGLLATLRFMREFRHGDIDGLEALRDKYGPISHLRAPIDAYVVTSPELATQVLQQDHRRYVKSKNYAQLQYLLGLGLVTSEGEAWIAQRRQLLPLFQAQQMEAHLPQLMPTIEQWADHVFSSANGAVVPLTEALGSLAVALSCALLFGAGAASESHEIRDALDIAGAAAVERIYALVRLPRWLPLRAHRRERAARVQINAYVQKRSMAVPAQAICGFNLLTEVRPALSPEARRAQLVTLLVAGQDTMLAALSWLLLAISTRPGLQMQIRREAQAAPKLAESTNSALDFSAYPTAHACVLEALRLWPPIPIVARTPTENVQLGGYVIPAGSVVLCAIRAMQRAGEPRELPLRFQPDLARSTAAPKNFAAFGLGPRRCIGERLATAELIAVLQALVLRGELARADAAEPVAYTTVAMRPAQGVHVRLTRHPGNEATSGPPRETTSA